MWVPLQRSKQQNPRNRAGCDFLNLLPYLLVKVCYCESRCVVRERLRNVGVNPLIGGSPTPVLRFLIALFFPQRLARVGEDRVNES